AVINDTTARDVQQKKHGGQWFKGKSLDGHGPIGPWIVPAADLDYDNLHLVTRVNGVVKQDANTRQMYFKVPRIIAELSLGLTLEPGDIIATGTPPGVGGARTPPEFLKPGDVMETEIAEIGTLRNVVQRV
ncbi:MAG TPA: fumarylacetoacetate hydrolase family protein, partial [Stellaceae bacterium]